MSQEKIDKITDAMVKQIYKNYEKRAEDTATLRSIVNLDPVSYFQYITRPKVLARKLLLNGILLAGAPLIVRTHPGQLMCEGIKQFNEVKSYWKE